MQTSLHKVVDQAFPSRSELRKGLHRSMRITSLEGSRDASQATISSAESAPDW